MAAVDIDVDEGRLRDSDAAGIAGQGDGGVTDAAGDVNYQRVQAKDFVLVRDVSGCWVEAENRLVGGKAYHER